MGVLDSNNMRHGLWEGHASSHTVGANLPIFDDYYIVMQNKRHTFGIAHIVGDGGQHFIFEIYNVVTGFDGGIDMEGEEIKMISKSRENIQYECLKTYKL